MNCPHCETPAGPPEWKARQTTLWANQYGYKVRLFCKVCGAWTDFTMQCGADRASDTETMAVVRSPERTTEWQPQKKL